MSNCRSINYSKYLMFKHIFEDGEDEDNVESGGRDEEVEDATEKDGEVNLQHIHPL